MTCPDHIKVELARIRADIIAKQPMDPKRWAQALRMRELMCKRLTPFQRAAWREVICSDNV